MTTTKEIPQHVPAELVMDFNFFELDVTSSDLQREWVKLRERAPAKVFWTPRNGGHWVALDSDDIVTVLTDYSKFSAQDIRIPPRNPAAPRGVPQETDPPEELEFRKIILPKLMPKKLGPLENRAREITISLIEGFKDKGECDFIEDFASILPLVVFLELVDLPSDHREMLKGLADGILSEDPDVQFESYMKMLEYLTSWLEKRKEKPGDDLLSRIATAKIQGEPISNEDALGLALNVMVGGLDTVVNMLGFFALFLAKNPGHRHQLIDNPNLIQPAVEELIRRHAMVSNGRRTVQDSVLSGVEIKAGDMILASTILYGTDPGKYDDPLTVDFSRDSSGHLTFGRGSHVCPGQHLARRELTVFLQEWLKRIPDFEVKPDSDLGLGFGHVGGLKQLHLQWDVSN